MSLVILKTNLKSLRYGKDRPGGGSSNQPYIKSPIPGDLSSTVVNPNNLKFLDKVLGTGKNLINFAGTDFFLRGGASAVSRAAKDVSRLTQMFADFKSPNGVLFAAKQNVLSLTGVKTQASGIMNEGIYLPTSTILQAGGNAFGVHLNKQGLNPFRSTSPSEGGLSRLFEFTGPLGLPTYAQTVKPEQEKQDNRLVQLANWKLKINTNPALLGPAPGNINELAQANLTSPLLGSTSIIFQNPTTTRTTYVQIKRSPLISSQEGEILQYAGGPQSLLGVGKTTIQRYSNTSEGLDFRKNPNFEGRYYVLNSTQISNTPTSKDNTQISDFREDLLSKQDAGLKKNILSISPSYSNSSNRIENRYKLGDPGIRSKNITNYVSGSSVEGKYLPLDAITSYGLYKSKEADKISDLVNFRIGIIDNNLPNEKVYIHFRAFLDSMDDNYNAEWNDFKYMGRGESFYRYNGFSRTINLSWTVAAQSKQELIPMYHKLNYLASSLAPDYSANGYMRGNLATLTVGGYLYEQPGIIKSINYSVPQESPWEIGIDNIGVNDINNGIDRGVNQLPHMIKVTGFQFVPIHTFVPKLQQNGYLMDEGGGGELELFGKEKYISLKNEDGKDNYFPLNSLRQGVVYPEADPVLDGPGAVFDDAINQ
jgi:hypothetical protein